MIRHAIGLAAMLCLQAPGFAESLYEPGAYRPLVADKRAQRIGDSLTIQVLESSSASTRADTTVRRQSGADLTLAAGHHRQAAAAGLGTEFDGGGAVQRSGRLLAQITATVTDVAPNGDLWISGEQVLEINADKQHIKVHGRVRAFDIGALNTVQSNRLADARISYVGTGDLADHQRPGMLSKVLLWMGL